MKCIIMQCPALLDLSARFTYKEGASEVSSLLVNYIHIASYSDYNNIIDCIFPIALMAILLSAMAQLSDEGMAI